MKKNLLDYLEKDPAKDESDASEKVDEAGDSLEDMKALLLLMKADSEHDQMKRAKAMLAAIKCVAGKVEKAEDATDEE